jgi:hypothetical protein
MGNCSVNYYSIVFFFSLLPTTTGTRNKVGGRLVQNKKTHKERKPTGGAFQ